MKLGVAGFSQTTTKSRGSRSPCLFWRDVGAQDWKRFWRRQVCRLSCLDGPNHIRGYNEVGSRHRDADIVARTVSTRPRCPWSPPSQLGVMFDPP